MSDDRKKYDSLDRYTNFGARLTKDAEVFPSKIDGKPPLVRITFASESRQEKSVTGWVEAKVSDRDANAAAFLKKGDTVAVEGKPVFEEYNGKTYFKLDRAEVRLTPDMIVKLKERGFTPGGGKAAPPPKKPVKKVVDVDFGDDD